MPRRPKIYPSQACPICDTDFTPRRIPQTYCSRSCKAKQKRSPLSDRFWSKVDKRSPDECWPWTGYTNAFGYGLIKNDRNYPTKAHRVAYAFAYDSIPDDLYVLHHCDNPSCCNPAHLFLGTQADNVHDMIAKGRAGMYLGVGISPRAKLTPLQVLEIKNKLTGRRGEKTAIAKDYGISVQTVSNIASGRHWKNLNTLLPA